MIRGYYDECMYMYIVTISASVPLRVFIAALWSGDRKSLTVYLVMNVFCSPVSKLSPAEPGDEVMCSALPVGQA